MTGLIRYPKRRTMAKATRSSGHSRDAISGDDAVGLNVFEGVMSRDGYRIFDSDTHVGPDARILASYLSAAEKDSLRAGKHTSRATARQETYTKGQRRYRRRLGTPNRIRRRAGIWQGLPG